MQHALLLKTISSNKLPSSNKVPSEMIEQTVVVNGISSTISSFTLNSEEDKTVFDLAGKRAKQAKKKRSKRKNGGHQSIRC